jgi:amino acid adenylation domain-containing protein
LRRLGANLRADGEQVRCTAPRGILTPSLRAEIARRKLEILLHLRHRPLSFGEESLWFLQQLQGDRADYNLSVAARLRGALDPASLARSLEAVARRHDMLRTTFMAVDGQPFRIVAAEPVVTLPLTDLGAWPADVREAELHRLAAAETRHPFDLARGPCWRAHLVRLDARDHVLIVAKHQIVSDGWSTQVLFRDLAASYRAFAAGTEPALEDLPMSYADFAEWQRASLEGDRLDALLAYWRRRLAGAPPALDLATDYARGIVETSEDGRQTLTLSNALSGALRALSRDEGVTPFMTLLAVFGALLHHYTGQDDVLVGSPNAGRNRPELASLIGFFVNTLVLRLDLSGDPTFRELLHRVRETAVSAYAHQELPFELLVEHLRPPRDVSRTPIFQAFFDMNAFASGRLALDDLTLDITRLHEPAAKFDLSLNVADVPTGFRLVLSYNTALFDGATVVAMLERYRMWLEAIVSDRTHRLSRPPWPHASSRGAPPPASLPGAGPSLASRFEAEVRRRPDAIAIDTEREVWSYADLNRRANRLARALLARLGRGSDRVALLFAHGAHMIAAILGVLKAGKTYVALDPLDPDERLRWLLEDAEASGLVTNADHAVTARELAGSSLAVLDVDDLGEPSTSEDIDLTVDPDALAYILYTSGSTGRPKGVMQTHRNVGYFTTTYAELLQLAHGDRLTLLPRYGSDAGVMDIFGALFTGATLAPFDLRRHEIAALPRWLARQAITVYHSTPTVYRHFLRSLIATTVFSSLRRVVIGGEAVHRDDIERGRRHVPPTCVFVNTFGPTESTMALINCVDRHTKIKRFAVSVGRPVPGTDVWLLDDARLPMHGHGVGEIAIRSPYISPGYWRRPDLTAAVFHADPAGGHARVYHTGDLGRRLPDGNLEYVGRNDWQVKVRGHRVEPGEIETVLREHPEIHDAAVVPVAGPDGDVHLIAYLVTASAPETLALRRRLQQRLPPHMLPAVFLACPDLPLTSTGKIDRRRLGRATIPPKQHDEDRVPHGALDTVIAGIWATVLGVAEIGRGDDFFELGGHSLLAVQVIARLRDAVGVEVPLRALFEAPTVADLARYVEEMRLKQALPPVPSLSRVSREHPLSASIAQEHIWAFDRLLPGVPVFTMRHGVLLSGPLDVAALQQSIDALVRRHEALRTTFAIADGPPAQVIADDVKVTVSVDDLRALPEAERAAATERLMVEDTLQPFDLRRGPLLRARVLRLGDDAHLLFVTAHHIIADGWSLGVIVDELARLYDAFLTGASVSLPDLPVQYADFASWQRAWQSHGELVDQLAYWRQQLREPWRALQLPANGPRGATLSFQAARATWTVSWELVRALKRLSLQETATLFMTVVAAFKMLLHRYTGQEDLRVATLVANRTRVETERVVGLFANTVILRTDLGGDPSGREVLRRVRATTLAAYANQDVPCEEVVRTLRRDRASLCQVMVILQNAIQQSATRSAGSLRFLDADWNTHIPPAVATTFDIVLVLRERPDGIAGTWLYPKDRFDAATIRGMVENYERVLQSLVEDPDRALSAFPSLPTS